MALHITTADVVRVLDDIVASVPEDYTYAQRYEAQTGRLYLRSGTVCTNYVSAQPGEYLPSCIAGEFFYRLGYRITEDRKTHSVLGLFFANGRARGDAFVGEGPTIDPAAMCALRNAQQAQDEDKTWPRAVDIAKNYLAVHA